MLKKYIVRLTDEERIVLGGVIKKLKGSSQKVRRAQLLLKADADGPGWTDARIADAFSCRTKTVEDLRERFVTSGFDETLDGKARATVRNNRLATERNRRMAPAQQRQTARSRLAISHRRCADKTEGGLP